MILAKSWDDYTVLDASGGQKLEKWGEYRFIRPDPQVIWSYKSNPKAWAMADGIYKRSTSGGGAWEIFNKKLPESWSVRYKGLRFKVRPTGFKHTGLFPEQAANWDFIIDKVLKENRSVKLLNLFGYTGGATVAALSAGAAVTHVDASKGMISWCRENVLLNNFADKSIRYLVDDAVKFTEKEIRRNNKYDAIIMDPPSYGRGPGGEVWTLEDKIYDLVGLCSKIMSDTPLFFILNSYTTGLAPTVLYNILSMHLKRKFGGQVTAEEIGLPIASSEYILPCGCVGRWTS